MNNVFTDFVVHRNTIFYVGKGRKYSIRKFSRFLKAFNVQFCWITTNILEIYNLELDDDSANYIYDGGITTLMNRWDCIHVLGNAKMVEILDTERNVIHHFQVCNDDIVLAEYGITHYFMIKTRENGKELYPNGSKFYGIGIDDGDGYSEFSLNMLCMGTNIMALCPIPYSHARSLGS